MKITTKHASNSLSRLSHTSILQPLLPAVLLRKLTKVSNKPTFARKNSTLWTVFRKPAFLVLECLKRRKKSFQFSKLSRYVWTDTWSNKFLLYFSSAHDWDRRIGAQILAPNWPMADRQPESAMAISFAVVFPCQLHAHFGLSTDRRFIFPLEPCPALAMKSRVSSLLT